MKEKRAVWLLLILVLSLVLAACGSGREQLDPAATTMQHVFNEVYEGTFEVWQASTALTPLLWGFFVFVVVGGGLMATTKSCAGSVIGGLLSAFIVVILVFTGIVGKLPQRAEDQAIHAMTEGIDMARFDKANQYVEILHAPLVAAEIQFKACERTLNRRTECYPYEWKKQVNCRQVCTCTSRDDDGRCTSESCHQECDTRHTPYFTQLARYYVVTNLYQGLATQETGLAASPVEHYPVRYLSGWKVPLNYQWYGSRKMNLSPDDTAVPPQWTRYEQMLRQGEIPLINVYHRYVNWLLTTDNIFAAGGISLGEYEQAGLLPQMNELYALPGENWAVEYKFVQFVGGLQVEEEESRHWQRAMAEYSTYFSNDREASLILIFAPEAEVNSLGGIDRWADAILAHYNQDKFPIQLDEETLKRMLPKNKFFLACTVGEDRTIAPDGCRLKTAMPRGNERIQDCFAMGRDPALQQMSMDVDSFFGNISSRLAPREGQPYLVVELIGLGQNPMSLFLREDPKGARRISMTKYEYLEADIQLSAKDISNLVNQEIGVQKQLAKGRLMTALWIDVVLVLALLFLFLFSQTA